MTSTLHIAVGAPSTLASSSAISVGAVVAARQQPLQMPNTQGWITNEKVLAILEHFSIKK